MAMSFEEFNDMTQNLTIDTLANELMENQIVKNVVSRIKNGNAPKELLGMAVMLAGLENEDIKTKVDYVSNELFFATLYEKFKNEGVKENAN